jgi:hypothetical protein
MSHIRKAVFDKTRNLVLKFRIETLERNFINLNKSAVVRLCSDKVDINVCLCVCVLLSACRNWLS